jgi:outer membrane protein
MRTPLALSSIALAAALASTTVSAQSLAVRGGFANVNPKSDNGTLAGAAASINSDSQAVLCASYFFENGVELAFDMPAGKFEHTVTLAGLGEVVALKHQPISLGANWHFLGGDEGGFSPYVGLGYNWTSVSEVRGTNALAGAALDVDDSNGLTATLGADFLASDRWFVRGEARWIETAVKCTGAVCVWKTPVARPSNTERLFCEPLAVTTSNRRSPSTSPNARLLAQLANAKVTCVWKLNRS